MDVSFEQMYQQVSEKYRPQLEEMGKSIGRKLWIARALSIVVIVLIIWLLGGLALYIVLVPIAAFFSYKQTLKRPYVLFFRENVARSFVALVDSSLLYSPEPSASEWGRILEKYHTAQFEGIGMVPVNGVRGSPGLSNAITGEIEGHPFQLCCMSLQGSGGKNDKRKFKGLFVSMKVSKPLNGFIKTERKTNLLLGSGIRFIPRGERKKMDSAAFMKDFFVGSNDQVTAMRYLTADVMELMINFKNELMDIQRRFNRDILPQNPHAISLDFFWHGNEVLMRIGNKKMFKPTLRNPMCKDSLACCLATLTFATKLNHVITKSIKETSI